jgi:two-component system, chemotaxis family, CheB/CheR fusion protein
MTAKKKEQRSATGKRPERKTVSATTAHALAESERPAPRPPETAEPIESPAAELAEPAFCVVGIGASAGGLEALTELFGALRQNSGHAFVVVSHLDPEHKSAMPEILAKVTRMPVAAVRDGMHVVPDHVYVIPPNTEMGISDGTLTLAPRPTGRAPPMPIDAFFCGLAAAQATHAVGVVLSGTGADGTRGLQAIKTAGGATFAQDQTARHDGMPRSAVAAGCVDMVLSPAGIAAALQRINACPLENGRGEEGHLEAKTGDAADFREILRLLSRATAVDFTHYKYSTLWRRTQRRMMLRKAASLAAYLEILRGDGAEVQALFDEALLQVSGFFRDPEVFTALEKKVFPALLDGRSPSQPLRIWVAGCARGEEAYSLAIVVLEYLEKRSVDVPIKIFATDISERALAAARAGEYSAQAIADLSSARQRQFFEKYDGGYRIKKAIRDLCVFARQDVTRDPPFSQLDLISCRNLLIYLDVNLQARVLPVFHYALQSSGYLLLGMSETVGHFADLFDDVDAKHRIYRRSAKATHLTFDFLPGGPARAPAISAAGDPGAGAGVNEVRREADRVILARYAPCGVVVDEHLQIVQFRGHTGTYLEPAPGLPTLNLYQMVRTGYLAELREVLEKAQRKNRPARHENIQVKNDGKVRDFHLEVIPMTLPGSGRRYFMVLFEDAPTTRSSRAPAAPRAPASRVESRRAESEAGADNARLKDELAATRHYLQAIIEAKEASNEELKAANEEIVSSNEELQSTNEELETAKEELQATNEELNTVNDELQSRIRVSTQLSDDLANLIDSVNIPTLVVGADLRLRRFTPCAHRVLSLRAGDVGRSIGDFKLKINLPDLEPLIHEVLDKLTVKELEVTDHQGVWYRMMIRPYKTSDMRIDGAVITLLDIDLMKRREAALAISEERFRMLVEGVREYAIFSLDPEGRVASWNRGAERLIGYRQDEIVGEHYGRFFTPEDIAAHKPESELELASRAGRTELEGWCVRKDGTRYWANTVLAAVRGADGSLHGFAKITRDITDRKQMDREIAEAAAQEQQRIGQELHDSVGQELTALGLLSESMVESLTDRSDPDAKLATKITGGLRRVLDQVRAITQGLVPVEVDGAGLMAALTDLALKVSEHPSVECAFECAQPVAIDDNQVATQLFRIAQEAVTNALKHGRPHQIRIELAEIDGHIVLTVRDDGTGLAESATTGGMGLKIMRYRAGLINATLTIDPGPEGGTVVVCTLTEGNRHETKQTSGRGSAGSHRRRSSGGS